MTPAERNRVRRIRDLLAEFEREPKTSVAELIHTTAGDLIEAAERGDEERRADSERRTAEALSSLREAEIKTRLEYLRGEIRAERISYGELAELQGLAEHIEPGDVELLEPAGVPEFPEHPEVEVEVEEHDEVEDGRRERREFYRDRDQ